MGSVYFHVSKVILIAVVLVAVVAARKSEIRKMSASGLLFLLLLQLCLRTRCAHAAHVCYIQFSAVLPLKWRRLCRFRHSTVPCTPITQQHDSDLSH